MENILSKFSNENERAHQYRFLPTQVVMYHVNHVKTVIFL